MDRDYFAEDIAPLFHPRLPDEPVPYQLTERAIKAYRQRQATEQPVKRRCGSSLIYRLTHGGRS